MQAAGNHFLVVLHRFDQLAGEHVGDRRQRSQTRDDFGEPDEVYQAMRAVTSVMRAHQILTPVWYSAYPGLTAVNVENNAAIRAGLYGGMTNEEAAAWLRRL